MKDKLTAPCGKLRWCIGSDDDFYCFDFHVYEDKTVTLQSVINSETGLFIQDAQNPARIPLDEAVSAAKDLVSLAMKWCIENGVNHDCTGWNNTTSGFWKAVQKAIKQMGWVNSKVEKQMIRPEAK